MSDDPSPPELAAEPAPKGEVIYRHRLATRIWHWVNAMTIFVMIGSGIGILNAHPRLYWGQYGANFDQPWLDLTPYNAFLHSGWFTIPGQYNLAMSRRWHLLFALLLGFGLLAYMIASLINRHFVRDLRVTLKDVGPRHLLADALAHLRLDFQNHENPSAYNILQKLTYVVVIFGLLPAVILSGLTMSPGMDAAWPWLLDLFGGRQSARSVHFIAMAGIVGFIVVHLALVILAGPVKEVMSMITGRWRLPPVEPPTPDPEPEPAE